MALFPLRGIPCRLFPLVSSLRAFPSSWTLTQQQQTSTVCGRFTSSVRSFSKKKPKSKRIESSSVKPLITETVQPIPPTISSSSSNSISSSSLPSPEPTLSQSNGNTDNKDFSASDPERKPFPSWLGYIYTSVAAAVICALVVGYFSVDEEALRQFEEGKMKGQALKKAAYLEYENDNLEKQIKKERDELLQKLESSNESKSE